MNTNTNECKLIILQTVIPDYRNNLFVYLKSDLKDLFILFGGQSYFEHTVKTPPEFLLYKEVKNIYFLNRKLLFQFGFWDIVAKNNIMVIEMNPRIISNWLILILRKLLNKKTIVWGHAWPRLGAESKTDILRGLMRKLADTIIVYTATQKVELQNKMPKAKILHAPNSVYFKSEMATNLNVQLIKNLIYVGRLTKSKKPLLLVKGFHSVLQNIPKDAKLIIVGDGEEKEQIIDYIMKNKLQDKINVLGHIGDYKILKELYGTALFSVSPGYVGLSITQSFSFGVPMLISRDELHSPEIEAAIENENSIFFKSDNIEEIGCEIIRFYEEKEYWINRRKHIVEFCRDNYSIEEMSKSFKSLLIT